MKSGSFLGIYFTIGFLLCLFVVMPVSADLDPDFDWEVYRIDTADWAEYTDYIQYDGVIYEVRFTDMTSGAVNSWKWEFGEDDWWGSTKENPVRIFTEEEAEDDGYTIKVTLVVTDSSGVPYQTSKHVYLDPDDPWNLKTVYDLTPEPTATPTPVPTAAPTAAPTATPTPEPTPSASHTYQVAGISKEMTKLQNVYENYIMLIKDFFGKIGIQIN
ncbi:MAG: hypothetical protein JXQ82_01480 [Methanomicrobiaceae archaeon]|nr:hypothetical protein [Methanomicrobiaceae archaeon]